LLRPANNGKNRQCVQLVPAAREAMDPSRRAARLDSFEPGPHRQGRAGFDPRCGAKAFGSSPR
jgi:hypothetical protein